MNDTEKTLRPDDLNEATARPTAMNDEATARPIDINEDTARPAANDEATARPVDVNEETARPSKECIEETLRPLANKRGDASTSKQVTFKKIYNINGKPYQVVKVISNGLSGEADVALVVDANKNKYALKIYRKGNKPNEEVMKALKAANKEGYVVSLYCYGYLPDEPLYFELMEYMKGQALDSVEVNGNEALLKTIALQSARCLNFCHEHHILHKDVKPGNFFIADPKSSELKLGDFGISDIIDENGFSYSLQSGTTTYNAPEVYNAAANQVRLTAKSDFYSLGIMLMSIWMGEAKFRVEMDDKAGRDRVFELYERKQKGNLPYPNDLSADLLTLLKGLTAPDEHKRWGYEQVEKWAKGEVDLSIGIINDVPFVFDERKGLVAQHPAELAVIFDEDPGYAVKLIRRGKIGDWLHECKRDRMASMVSEAEEEIGDDAACLAQVRYILDPTIPYCRYNDDGDVIGEECSNLDELAVEVLKMEPQDSEFMEEDSDFYAWLYAHEYKDEADDCQDLAADCANTKPSYYDMRWIIARVLNPNLPFVAYIGQDVYTAETLADVVDIYRQTGVDYTNAMVLCSDSFMEFVRDRNEGVADRIQRLLNGNKNKPDDGWGVLYCLAPDRSYELTESPEQGPCHKTMKEIGRLINEAANRRTEDGYKQLIWAFEEIGTKRDTRLNYYLKVKGADKQIDWLKYCYDVNSKTNKNKCTPYNKEYALWRGIKMLLGKDENPVFQYHNLTVKSIADLFDSAKKSAYVNMLREEEFKAWLASFYQENPFEDLSVSGRFEDLAHKWLYQMELIDARAKEVVRFRKAKIAISNAAYYAIARLRTLRILQVVFPILYCGIGVLYIYWLRKYGFSGFDGGFMRSFLYTVGYIFAIYVVVKIFRLYGDIIKPYKISSAKKGLPNLKDFNTTVVQPLYFAFKSDDDSYDFPEKDYCSTLASRIAKGIREISRKMSIRLAVLLAVTVGYAYLTPQLLGDKSKLIPKDYYAEDYMGLWKGKFDGKTAAFNVESVDRKKLTVKMSVKFSKWANEDFQGVIEDSTLTLYDSTTNGILDGTFKGTVTFDEKGHIYKGIYTNNKTGKEMEFEFTRQDLVDND